MPRKTIVGPKARLVLGEYEKSKLRSSSGEKVTDFDQAFAIAMSEQRAARRRGASMRTWRGRRRMRPNLTQKARRKLNR